MLKNTLTPKYEAGFLTTDRISGILPRHQEVHFLQLGRPEVESLGQGVVAFDEKGLAAVVFVYYDSVGCGFEQVD